MNAEIERCSTTRLHAQGQCRLIVAVIAMLSLGLSGCEYSKNIQEYPEAWQPLEPGQRLASFPAPRVITEGRGQPIDKGDLVQLHIRSERRSDGVLQDRGEWWIWIGFRTREETRFFSDEPALASAMVGLREGTKLEFVTTERGRSTAGVLRPNVFGDNVYYSWRKNTQDFSYIYVPTESSNLTVEIKRVCKGQAQFRTVRFFDDGPVRVHTGGLGSYTSHEPREAWIDEARIEAKCADGKTATFQYGPIDSMNGKEGRSPVRGYFDQWLSDAWQRIPRGVQLK